jgi:NAD(P)-dependent dehydrogenase (short-subunit alcohol dehydrogenase family)
VRVASARLEGRVAVVSGAGSSGPGIGNGRAAAVLLARERARVAVVDASPPAARETAALIEADRGECMALEADAADASSCTSAIEAVARRWGRIDVLVNNVGIHGPRGSAADVDDAEWERALRVNVTSMMLMAKQAIPHMRRQGRGAIVNVASVAGLRGGHPDLLYPTSKGAVINMTRAMAAHHGREGIRVNCVAPGAVYTPMVAGGMAPAVREARRRQTLLGTEGDGWDVGHAIVFLCCDESRWITGVVLPVDGGASAAAVHPSSIPLERGEAYEQH